MNRRELIASVAAAPLAARAASAARAEKIKPQIDDVLVHAFGEHAGAPIAPGNVGNDRLFAFPMAPDGVVRDGTLHNQVSLLRIDEASMTEATRRYATGPFVAVSASCTHTGCEVGGWQPETSLLVCPCHGSRFDVLDGARVVLGPAPKPLAFLPIEQSEGVFRVIGRFSRRVGPPPTY